MTTHLFKSGPLDGQYITMADDIPIMCVYEVEYPPKFSGVALRIIRHTYKREEWVNDQGASYFVYEYKGATPE